MYTKHSAGSIPQLFKWVSTRFTQLWFWLTYLSIFSVCSPDLNKCLEDGRPHSSIRVLIRMKKAFNQAAQGGCDPTLGCCWSYEHASPSWCLPGVPGEHQEHETQGTDRSAPNTVKEKPWLNMFYKYLQISGSPRVYPDLRTQAPPAWWKCGMLPSAEKSFLLSKIWVERSQHGCDWHSQLPKNP